MGEIMQWTAPFSADGTAPILRHGQSNMLVYPCHTRRGLPLTSATDGTALIERVVCAADLDAAMRAQLTRVLLITVRDWSRK